MKIIQQYFHRVTCFFASLNDQNSVLDIESKTQKHSLFIGRNSFGNISFQLVLNFSQKFSTTIEKEIRNQPDSTRGSTNVSHVKWPFIFTLSKDYEKTNRNTNNYDNQKT